MINKLDNSDFYVRTIKYSWVKPLMLGEITEEGTQDFMLELIFKVLCDKDGNAVEEDDLSLDDFQAATAHIMSKLNSEKKS